MHAGKLGPVTNFRPTIIVDGTAKHCIDQYMVSFRYCLIGSNTVMPGGLHARLYDTFLVMTVTVHGSTLNINDSACR